MLQYDSDFRVLKIKINEKCKVLLNSFSIHIFCFSVVFIAVFVSFCLVLKTDIAREAMLVEGRSFLETGGGGRGVVPAFVPAIPYEVRLCGA